MIPTTSEKPNFCAFFYINLDSKVLNKQEKKTKKKEKLFSTFFFLDLLRQVENSKLICFSIQVFLKLERRKTDALSFHGLPITTASGLVVRNVIKSGFTDKKLRRKTKFKRD